MNRIDRLTAILIQLQSRKIVKAQDIADRFETSLRTVYRDIRSLEEAGVPIVGEAGIGYSLMEGYRLPPVMFTREEATAFLMAEKIVESYTDVHNTDQYKSAMYKIRAVLRTREKEFLENVENNILVLKNELLLDANTGDKSLQTILKCIDEKRVVSINYQAINAREPTQRCIEPIGIFLQNNRWYLIAFCRLRVDYRTFRVDRLSDFAITEESFTTEHPTLIKYLENIVMETDLQTVIIQFDRRILRYIESQKYYFGFVSEKDLGDQVEIIFLAESLEGLARWFLMVGDQAVIVRPAALKDRVKSLLTEISSRI